MRNLKFFMPVLFLVACGGKDSSSTSSSGSASTTRGATGTTATGGSSGTSATTGSSTGTTSTTATSAGSTGSRGSTGSTASTSAATSSSSSSASSSGSTGTSGAPAVIATDPRDTDVGFATDLPVTVTFSTAMSSSSLNANTFLVQSGVSVDGGMNAVAGTIAVTNDIATFTASAPLNVSTVYTVTITTGAKDTSGNALAAPYIFSFTTHSRPGAVNLGAAGNYVILAETKISTVPASAITGDLGISPNAASFITGFSLTADASNTFSTSPQVTGKIFAADYTPPTPSNLTTAVTNMGTAFVDAAGRAPDVIDLGAGEIGGKTLSPGVYKWGTGLLISTDVHLEGSPTDVWIFEIAQDLSMANGTNVFLAGGALPKNIFWQVSGQATLGTTSHFEGVILSQTQITLGTGASVNGRLLAQSAVVLDTNTVVVPAP